MTRFKLSLPDVTFEIEGETTFVEDLYKIISRDLEPMLQAASAGDPIDLPPLEHESSPRKPDTRKSNYTWVYHCTSLFNKVYVTENHIISNSIIGRFVDVEKVRRIHVDKSRNTLLDVLFNDNRTLWAEFTAEGRELLQNTVNDNT